MKMQGILIYVPISMKKSKIDQNVDENEGYQKDILFHLLARCWFLVFLDYTSQIQTFPQSFSLSILIKELLLPSAENGM